jgi:hypothetical protein
MKYAAAALMASGGYLCSSAPASAESLSAVNLESLMTVRAVKIWHCQKWSGGWG